MQVEHPTPGAGELKPPPPQLQRRKLEPREDKEMPGQVGSVRAAEDLCDDDQRKKKLQEEVQARSGPARG